MFGITSQRSQESEHADTATPSQSANTCLRLRFAPLPLCSHDLGGANACIKGRVFHGWSLVLYHHHHRPLLPITWYFQSNPLLATRSTLRSSMPTNSDHATLDMAGLYASMQREIASLRASQIAANREITYLRRNQDRVVREIGSEMRHMRRGVKVMQNQLEEIEESQRMLLCVLFILFLYK